MNWVFCPSLRGAHWAAPPLPLAHDALAIRIRRHKVSANEPDDGKATLRPPQPIEQPFSIIHSARARKPVDRPGFRGTLPGEGIEVAGQLEEGGSVGGSNVVRRVFPFVVKVVGDTFALRSYTAPPTNYLECVFDGTDMYFLHHEVPKALGPAPKSPTGKPIVVPPTSLTALAIISTNRIPRSDGPSPYLWQAYASAPYFRSLQPGKAIPIWPLDAPSAQRELLTVDARYETFGDRLGLPRRVEYLNDGFYRGFDLEQRRVVPVPLPKPYDQGYTKATYRADSFTNVAGVSVPTEFTFLVYSAPLRQGEAPYPYIRLHGRATTVRTVETASVALPAFEGVAGVTDYRHPQWTTNRSGAPRPQGYLSYRVTNGLWLGQGQLSSAGKKHENLARWRTGAAPAKTRRAKHSRALAIGVIVIAAAPFAFLLYRRLRAHRTETKHGFE